MLLGIEIDIIQAGRGRARYIKDLYTIDDDDGGGTSFGIYSGRRVYVNIFFFLPSCGSFLPPSAQRSERVDPVEDQRILFIAGQLFPKLRKTNFLSIAPHQPSP
jgi:hypothetical protein